MKIYISNESAGDGQQSGNKSSIKFTQAYQVLADSENETPTSIAGLFPALGTRNEDDRRAYMVGKNVTISGDNTCLWNVLLTYSTERQISDNPLEDPILITWDTDNLVVPFLYDNQGRAILNSAGTLYGDAIKGDSSSWTISCVSNQAYIPTWIDDYRDAVNSDYCMIDGVMFEPGQCKIKKIHISQLQTRNDYQFRVLSLTIKTAENKQINTASGFRDVKGWSKNVIDESLYCWVNVPLGESSQENWILVKCMDMTGVPATKPFPLDGYGEQLIDPGPEDIIYNSFEIYKSLPFSKLPISN